MERGNYSKQEMNLSDKEKRTIWTLIVQSDKITLEETVCGTTGGLMEKGDE